MWTHRGHHAGKKRYLLPQCCAGKGGDARLGVYSRVRNSSREQPVNSSAPSNSLRTAPYRNARSSGHGL
jgi:hypothetical protein